MIEVNCSCGETYWLDDSRAGGTLECRRCGKRLSVSGGLFLDKVITTTITKQHTKRNWQIGTVLFVAFGLILAGIIWAVYSANPPTETESTPAETAANSKPPSPNPTSVEPTVPSPQLHWSTLPPCAEGKAPERPPTGRQIKPSIGTTGEFELLVKNGTDQDAVVRLVRIPGSHTSRFIYVQAKDTYRIPRIEEGNYDLRYILGKGWMQGCLAFWQDSGYSQFEDAFNFKPEERGNQRLKGFTVTLNPVLFGNAKTKSINREQFLQGE